ncbi:MAG: MlaD family protein [Candidatus Omnitrophota bacterium]|jgi:phospholipid/cholesterol/gamma-HCH transport system substrate-binding protein
MDETRTFELKVGIFILLAIAILFIMVFSIGDFNFVKPGYHIKVRFNFASGIGPSAPVRLAGVGVGQVEGIQIIYDENDKRGKAELYAWIQQDAKIEEDSDITINTLGLLGEKYLEIVPGTPGKQLLADNSVIVGRDPVPMEKITDNLAKLTTSVTAIVQRLERGEGTFGKCLTDESVYENIEAFTADIKKHPWKLLSKPKGE